MSYTVRKAYEDGLLCYVVEPDLARYKSGKVQYPVLTYFHGVIRGNFEERKGKVVGIKSIKELPGVNSLLKRMKHTPFTLIIPFCHDYQWRFVFNPLEALLKRELSNPWVEDETSIIGLTLGASWGFHFSINNKELVGRRTLVDPGNLDSIDMINLGRAKPRLFLTVASTRDGGMAKEVAAFKAESFEYNIHDINCNYSDADAVLAIGRMAKESHTLF